MFTLFKPKKIEPPKRFNVNQTLSNSSYRPAAGKAHQSAATGAPAFDSKVRPLPKEKSRFSFKKALLLLFIILLIPLLVIIGLDLRNASRASNKLFGSGDITGLLVPSTLDDTAGRVNILMVGYSTDDPGHEGAALTDSIMVVSLDKDSNTGYMLSIPRDLYVDIPGYHPAKINEAFQAGESQSFSESGYPSGGIGLLEKVITENFDIPVHYSVIINYGAVRDIVNALGGITVNIQSPDPRGLYDPNFKPQEGGPLKLANGQQEIDGQTALRLTRARGSTYGSYGFPQSDFNRIQNQQQVFAAIKSELNWKIMLDPRLNGRIFDAAASNTKTSVDLPQVLPMFRLLKSVPDGSLKPVNLSNVDNINYLAGFQTRDGQSALVPAAGVNDYSDIQTLIKRLNQ